jgi:hypothetical protein
VLEPGETKEFALFPGSQLGEHESVLAKSGDDDEMLACAGTAESVGGLRKCLFISREAGGLTWSATERFGAGFWS